MEGIFSIYAYLPIYLTFVGICVIFCSFQGNTLLKPSNPYKSLYLNTFIAVLLALFFGSRPQEGIPMGDTFAYAGKYADAIIWGDANPTLNPFEKGEVVWEWIMKFCAANRFQSSTWFSIIAFIYMISNVIAIRILLPNHQWLAFIFFLGFFLTYQGGINGIRNADAYSIILVAISLLALRTKRKYLFIILLSFIGYKIHSSVIITLVALAASLTFVRNTKFAILIWLISIVISLSFGQSFSETVIPFIEDPRADKYLEMSRDNDVMAGFDRTGFRWDFLLFSGLPIVLGYYVTVIKGIKDKLYQIILNTYILANAIWIIFMYMAFSNRFAMLSWFLYPYLLCYPLVKFRIWNIQKQSFITIGFLWIMFIFTVYMSYI